MSVVVRGMDYPNNCDECKIKSWDIDDYVCPFSGVVTLSIGRQTNCPLRPLPEKHGPMIDCQALLEEARRLSGPFVGDGWSNHGVFSLIARQPTIVEAEGE